MKSKYLFRIFRLFPVLLLIHLWGGGMDAYGAPADKDAIARRINQLLEDARSVRPGRGQMSDVTERARTGYTPEGYLKHLGAPPGRYFTVTDKVPGRPGETARNFLRENAELFGIISGSVDFRMLKTRLMEGRNHVKFGQTYAGIPVFGAQIIVQLNETDGVEYVMSDIAVDVNALDKGLVLIVPTISSAEAIARAHALFNEKNKDMAINTTTPILEIFDPSVLDSTGSIRLVWDINVYSEGSMDINEQILLDAHTGEIVRRYPKNIPALSRDIFDSGNTTANPGTRRRSDTTNPPGAGASGIVDVDDAYDFLGDSWNFFWNEHGRDSINGGLFPMTLSATTRFCSTDVNICGNPPQCPCANAFWNPNNNRLYFGDGYPTDDVVGHEYTHGVTAHESNLIYENQSGAMNESFSDIWGEFIDLTNNAGTDTQVTRWMLFEDDPRAGENWWSIGDLFADWNCTNGIDDDMDGFIDECPGTCRDGRDNDNDGLTDLDDPDCYERNMRNPTLKNQPDRMGSPLYFTGTGDHGGVHTNSGVGNKLAYLLTDGDIFNGQTVIGMGIPRIADLFYEVNTNLLTSSANYTDLYHSLRQAAINLHWSNTDRSNLYRACLAVEIADAGNDIYVDKSNGCFFPSGSLYCTLNFGGPFTSVADGVNSANPGDRLYIKTGTYSEALTIDKSMYINPWGGPVTIGK